MPGLEIAAAPRARELVVGIDLGTTNSLVAYMDGDVPRVIADETGRTLVPSVVSFDAEGPVVRDATDRLNHDTRHLAELLMDGALRAALASRRVSEAIEQG
jgi:molecular chaperone DnaK (HSP70)